MSAPEAPPTLTKWRSTAEWIVGLSLGQFLLILASSFAAILLWAMFEQRAQVWAQVGASPVLAGALGMGFFLVLLGVVISGLMKRSDDHSRALYESLRDQINDLKATEQECQRRLFELALRVHPERVRDAP